jgi:hypothetical protein
LSIAWRIFRKDHIGAILISFIYLIIVGIIPYLGVAIGVPLTIGFLGWAESRRKGDDPGPAELFAITRKNLPAAFFWLLTGFALVMILLFPDLLLGRWLGLWQTSDASIRAGGMSVLQAVYPILHYLLNSSIVQAALWIIFIPMIVNIMMLMGWGVARGVPFAESFKWSFSRMFVDFRGWWQSGLVLTFVLALGIFPGMLFGLVITLPLTMIAWSVMASNEYDLDPAPGNP